MKDLTVIHRDNGIIVSKMLLDRQNCWDNLPTIKELHVERMELEFMMDSTIDPNELKFLFEFWQDNQFRLQDAWGFERDATKHRFWYVPRCTCPKMDNDDRYFVGMYYISVSCPVHGD